MNGDNIIVSGYAIMPRIAELCKQINIFDDYVPIQEECFIKSREQIKVGKKGDVFNLVC